MNENSEAVWLKAVCVIYSPDWLAPGLVALGHLGVVCWNGTTGVYPVGSHNLAMVAKKVRGCRV